MKQARKPQEATPKTTNHCLGLYGFGTGYRVAQYGEDAPDVCRVGCCRDEECRAQTKTDWEMNFWAGYADFMATDRQVLWP